MNSNPISNLKNAFFRTNYSIVRGLLCLSSKSPTLTFEGIAIDSSPEEFEILASALEKLKTSDPYAYRHVCRFITRIITVKKVYRKGYYTSCIFISPPVLGLSEHNLGAYLYRQSIITRFANHNIFPFGVVWYRCVILANMKEYATLSRLKCPPSSLSDQARVLHHFLDEGSKRYPDALTVLSSRVRRIFERSGIETVS